MNTDWHEWRLPTARSRRLQAPWGESYRIDLAVPEGAAPPDGFPVIYLLDAEGCFATCVEAVRRMGRRQDATGVGPTVVVGIRSEEDGGNTKRRERDFTPCARLDGPAGGESGGAAAFLAFMEAEVIALVEREAPADRAHSLLLGHSLAGYFTLWAMGARPNLFRSYAAISPSIWWNPEALADPAQPADRPGTRLLITVGEWESALAPWHRGLAGADAAQQRRASRDMAGQARAYAERLRQHLGDGVQFVELPDEDHASILSAAIPRALRLACRP